jgi:hypothetical protein
MGEVVLEHGRDLMTHTDVHRCVLRVPCAVPDCLACDAPGGARGSDAASSYGGESGDPFSEAVEAGGHTWSRTGEAHGGGDAGRRSAATPSTFGGDACGLEDVRTSTGDLSLQLQATQLLDFVDGGVTPHAKATVSVQVRL